MESHKKSSPRRVLVLCFDGTGNTFRVDGAETNILKIFRMVDRTEDEQTGIGADITPTSLASDALRRGRRLWTNKVLDLALGHSFDQHLIGGYRFLMRHYRSRCKVYIFGFSRGAYTARFLDEMLDYVGLLGPDNEEMIPFVWEAFATWKLSSPHKTTERQTAFVFLKACRETICRPVCRVQFLGLFDTVNSIAKFQVDTREMAGSRFIRHAVSIDERRVKFQPVLFRPGTIRRTQSPDELTQLHVVNFGESRQSRQSIVSQVPAMHDDEDEEDDDDGTTDIQEVWFPGGHADIGGGWQPGDEEQWSLSHAPLVWMVHEAQWAGLRFDPDKLSQGGCWDGPSDLPIQPRDDTEEGEGATAPGSGLFDRLHLSATRGVLHDLLQFGQGLPPASVLLWRVMEYLPLGRMHLQADGSLNLVHWPLPCGAVRDIPKEAEIYASAIC